MENTPFRKLDLFPSSDEMPKTRTLAVTRQVTEISFLEEPVE
jgi:hypothetical protein